MTARNGEGFPRAARVRRRREFLSLARGGERRRTPHFVVIRQCSAMPARLGITVSRKVGNAVARNLLKRRIREAFRRHPMRRVLTGTYIVIAKSGIGAVCAAIVERELRPAFLVASIPDAT